MTLTFFKYNAIAIFDFAVIFWQPKNYSKQLKFLFLKNYMFIPKWLKQLHQKVAENPFIFHNMSVNISVFF